MRTRALHRLLLPAVLALAGARLAPGQTPAVNNGSGATNVTASSATLCGNLTSTGTAGTAVSILWGRTDGGTNAAAWSNRCDFGVMPVGAFSTNVTGLTPNTVYYCRCWASNAAGVVWAGSTTNFSTWPFDSDSDGMPDWWEVAHGLNRLTDDSAGDPDGDGYKNIAEWRGRSDPQDGLSWPDGRLIWAKRAGGSSTDMPVGGAVCTDGAAYACGQYQGSPTFGSGETNETTISSAGGNDLFVAQYLSDGRLGWVRHAGTPGASHDIALDVAALPGGDVAVAGRIGHNAGGSATFGSGESNETTVTSAGAADAIVARYGAEGRLAWVKRAGGTGDDNAYGVTPVSDGGVVAVGYFEGTATFGPGEANETNLLSAGDRDVFVASYQADGELAWARRIGGAGPDHSDGGVNCPSADTILVSGAFDGTATFGAGETNAVALVSAGGWDVFVAMYGMDGRFLWARRAGGPGGDFGYRVAGCGDGGFVLAGSYGGAAGAAATFGAGEARETTLESSGNTDGFLARYDGNGALLWVRGMGGAGADATVETAVLRDGSILVSGSFSASATFGRGEPNETVLGAVGSEDAFLARYSAGGEFLWAKPVAGTASEDNARAISCLPNGECVLAGHFGHAGGGSATLGKGETNETILSSAGASDIFVARYAVTLGATPPTVNNSTGASVTATSGTLCGNLTATGGAPTTVRIYWGAADGGTVATNWASVTNLGVRSVGPFSADTRNLTPDTLYYYRCWASNAAGVAWAAESAMFQTGPDFAPAGMVRVPGGTFEMGDSFAEAGASELPVHSVYVSAFHVEQRETSYAKWCEVYQWAVTNGYTFDNPGAGKATDHPVQSVNWYDCVKWCNARSEKEGLAACYTVSGGVYRSGQSAPVCDWAANGYRLPTEAEWEKAARGGLSGKRFGWGDTIGHDVANYCAWGSESYDLSKPAGYNPAYTNGGDPYTCPVDALAANPYGLRNMAGNAWEWCWDWFSAGYYATSPASDPTGPATGTNRVWRGGGWNNWASAVRNAYRDHFSPTNQNYIAGFRCVRSSQRTFDDGLVAYYPFNGNANDESGNGHTGVVTGAILHADRFGSTNSAYLFNGSNDYVDVGNISLGTTFSLSAWVRFSPYPRTPPTDFQTIFSSYPGSGSFVEMGISWGPVTRDWLMWYDTTGIGHIGAGPVSGRNWCHVVGTCSSGHIALYVDGSLCATGTTVSASNGQLMTIGAYKRQDSDIFNREPWNGLIDEVRIYNRALSTNEVRRLYTLGDVDTDSDGLPDWWEQQYFGNLSQNGSGDADADGRTNLEEYQGGTNPQESNLGDGLVGYYSFDETTGTILYDGSGRGHNGTNESAQRTTGFAGNALQFDGVSQRAIVPANGDFDALVNSITIGAWIKRDEVGHRDPVVESSINQPNGSCHFLFEIEPDNTLWFAFSDYPWSYWRYYNSTGTVTNTSWHHVAVTYDRTQEVFYIDGAVAGVVAETTPLQSHNEPLRIGERQAAWPFNYFKGKLDEVRVYNRALSSNEVRALSGGGTPTVDNASGATNIAATFATLNGNLTSTGTAGPAVSILWGRSDGGTTAGAWSNRCDFGVLPVGPFSTNVTGLVPGSVYYYRCWASNAAGVSWAAESASFTAGASLDYGLVAHYPLDGDGSDVSGNGHHLTVNGATSTNGIIGRAVYFDGSLNDYLIADPFNGFPSNEITCSFWIQTTNALSATPISYNISGNDSLWALQDARNWYVIRGWNNPWVSGVAVNDGTWHHMVVTWRSVDGRAEIYVDGHFRGSGTVVNVPIPDGGALVIGQDQDERGGGFTLGDAMQGTLDDFRIYNRALSSEEVRSLYEQDAYAGMALIPAGSFVMGDTFGEGASDELPLHTNYISAEWHLLKLLLGRGGKAIVEARMGHQREGFWAAFADAGFGAVGAKRDDIFGEDLKEVVEESGLFARLA